MSSKALTSFTNNIAKGKAKANSVAKNLTRKLFLNTGIVEYDTNQGKFVFVSNSSNLGVEENEQNILDNLARLSENLTPPQIVKAHTEYYFTCNPVEQSVLLNIIKQREDKIQTDIAEFYAEK